MICEKCKQRPATVHVTKITNGIKEHSHLCEPCAQGETNFNGFADHSQVFDFLSGLLSGENWGHQVHQTLSQPVACPVCGTTYQKFSRTGLLGCCQCYEQFAEPLDSVLRRIHGANRHTGKVPERRGGSLKLTKELESLRSQLQQAVGREEFEQAAALRDRIKELEKAVEKEGR